jgi:putative DNA primase/helicase
MTEVAENVTRVNPGYWELGPARAFLGALAGNSLTTFQTLPDRPDSHGLRPLIVHGPLLPNHEILLNANRQGHAVSIMVNEGDGRGRKAGNVIGVRSVFVDLDGAPLQPIWDALLRPQIIVESSPRKYHAYWLVDGLPLDLFGPVQRALATKFNGDPAVCDLPRVMRVPGFFHWKSSTPFASRLVESNHDPHYSPDDILNFAEVDPAIMQTNSSRTNRPGSCLTVVPATVGAQESRNCNLTSLAGTMRRRGMSEAAIFAALTEENQQRYSPALTDEEVRRIAESVARYEPPPQEFRLTDLGNAERLVHYHGQDLRYCRAMGGWLIWDGRRWAQDKTGEVERRAKVTVRSIYAEAETQEDDQKRKALAGYAMGSENKCKIEAMVKLAQSEAGVVARPEHFDTDPYMLNCSNGTLDLRSGELRPHRREDMITSLAPVEYDPKAKCPRFEEFIGRIMGHSQELISYLQRALGYSLTGITVEQCWFFCHGTGANGKSTLLNTVQHVMGDYGKQSSPETILAKRGDDGPRNDLARLKGARLVGISEPNPSKRLDEAIVKMLTGEDRITCRFLNKEFFEYIATFKLFILANHKPDVQGTDHAFWRRVHLIPFAATIPPCEQDPHLGERLKAESSGILRWMVQGCLDWQNQGLNRPPEVLEATEEYREETDPLTDFIADECDVGAGKRVATRALYERYREYCGRNGQRPLSQKVFGGALSGKGFQAIRSGRQKRSFRLGLSLKEESRQDSPAPPAQTDEDICQEDPLSS